MISKNKAKFIVSLQKKKARDEEGFYVIEGDKLIKEFLSAGVQLETLVAKPDFIGSLSVKIKNQIGEIEDASQEELKKLSSLTMPHNALAVVRILENKMDMNGLTDELCVALDFIQDPGNLGTIIRSAAWFGIRNIVCSADCVDIYNPKVIQASMGAILHVNVFYSDLNNLFIEAKERQIPVYGTVLDGESIYDQKLNNKGIILLGNESRGISGELMPFLTHKLMIPGAAGTRPGIDSLNVGMAAAVVFYEFRRKSSRKGRNSQDSRFKI